MSRAASTSEYLAGCRAGDRGAFKRLYQEFAPYVYTICRRYGVREDDCADKLQDIFAEIFSCIDRFKAEKGTLRAWIRSIAVHKILSSKRRRVLDVVHLNERHDMAGSDLNALHRLEEADLLRLIDRMPDGYRTIFNLYVVDGYAHDEICEILGIRADTSRSQLSRARKWLQRHLQAHYARATNPAPAEPQIKLI